MSPRRQADARDSIRPVPAVRMLLDYRPALRQRTGVGEYVHETARALAAAPSPQERIVLFSSSWRDRLSQGVVPGLETVDCQVPVQILNFSWHRLGWPPVERLTGGTFDLVHAAHPLLIPTRRAAQVVTIYDLDFLDAPERTHREIRRDYPSLTPTHARRADHIVVISAHTAQAVETRLGVPRSRITICRPGAPAWQRRAAEPAAGGCILFLGSLDPRKNLDVLLDAYARLVSQQPNAPRLVMAGQIPASAEALIRRTRERALAGRVDVPGYVSEADKRALFDRALVFVLPSHTEGFGIPAVEAMAAGVPVIAANRGALPEAVGAAGRLVSPDDAEALAAALSEVLSDAALRQRMSDAGWQHVRQFTWAGTASGVREAWAHALETRARRRG